MKKNYKETISAKGFNISIYTLDFEKEFLSLTDIARYKSDDPSSTIQNWMRGKDVIEFLGLWEQLNNPNFKPLEFEGLRNKAGSNAFTISPKKWIEKTNAKGIISKSGKNGGTFAHLDIAFEFASWISPEFKLYIIKDYERLKAYENNKLSLEWNLNREIAKINYRIHTDAIKNNLLPPRLTKAQISYVYANEADMLNVVLFGQTSKEWHTTNKNKTGNIRDYASIQQLLVLANMESYNAILIKKGIRQSERIIQLRELAMQQLNSLISISDLKLIKKQ